ncbi:hypothetical protein Dsin_014044 [Dipteronia sinensis]|uniref:Glycosyltransferase n=1 Tax=Dipteronia sinensis TaxID=43782 RepID=A0AAE0E9P0_9ROSI|nr:hypothetical protein Dsin_014044 [Dipteronia sinensis]
MADTIVLYPSPGRGHLVSMVEFGQLILKHHPASIAIIIPTAPFESASSSTVEDYIASASSSLISFHHLPAVDPLPPNFSSSSSPAEIPALTYELAELNNPNLHKTLLKLSVSSKLKGFVIDFFCNASFKVSSTFNIPTYYYFTSGASGLAAFLYFKTIHENTTESLKDFDDMPLDFPGIPSIPAKDMPVAMLDRESKVYRCFVDTATQMIKSAGLILNTFEFLEERAVKAVLDGQCTPSESAPPIYCVGPVIGGNDSGSGDRGEVEHECLSWLDSQPSRSVVFLSFGSMGVFYTKQLKEIANGLESSRVRFLWVVRAPPPDDETRRTLTITDLSIERFLPEGFLDRTKDRGLVVMSWAPQIAVLNHDSVGGFVTHCGWNSILEGVCAGVPMLAWPLYAEQKMNRAFLVEGMKVALPVVESDNGLVTAAELEKRVTELMDSEKGRSIRDRVTVLRKEAAAATSHGGSSHLALTKLAESFQRN